MTGSVFVLKSGSGIVLQSKMTKERALDFSVAEQAARFSTFRVHLPRVELLQPPFLQECLQPPLRARGSGAARAVCHLGQGDSDSPELG